MKGFIIYDYQVHYDEGLQHMAQWYQQGKLQHRETIVDGLENMPQAFLGLFKGENLGKQIIKIAEPDS